MKLGFKLVAAVALALALAAPAQALTITPTSGTINVTRWEGDETSQSEINAVIWAIMGSTVTEYYKAEPPSSEFGPLAGAYNTVFYPTTDPYDATITHVAGMPYIGPTAYALVKDGNADPAWYLFNLTALGWNGTAVLYFDGFWEIGKGAISHVALYGGSVVPDGGSVSVLLGAALLGLAGLRRFMK
jgi:hypothetical protein